MPLGKASAFYLLCCCAGTSTTNWWNRVIRLSHMTSGWHFGVRWNSAWNVLEWPLESSGWTWMCWNGPQNLVEFHLDSVRINSSYHSDIPVGVCWSIPEAVGDGKVLQFPISKFPWPPPHWHFQRRWNPFKVVNTATLTQHWPVFSQSRCGLVSLTKKHHI